MDRIEALRTEPISKTHQRKQFCCGKPELDTYLAHYARQNDEKNLAKTFVAVNVENQVLGYYSLSSARIEFEELPPELSQQLPAYPIPAALIARLAVDESTQGEGLGARLLIDALRRILSASEEIAVKVVLVDALDQSAKDFYQHYGFMAVPGQEMKLFLPIETINGIF